MGEGIAETFVIMRAMVVIGEDYKISCRSESSKY